MITTKENGVQYPTLTKAIINWHSANNMTISFVERPLSYNTVDDIKQYVDDITALEIEKGYEKIREFLYKETTDPMFFRVQRGEILEQEWLDAVQNIKNEYSVIIP